MIVESRFGNRYSVGSWLLAFSTMLLVLLLIKGRGGKASALGDPAVQGPKMVSGRLVV